MTKKKMLYTRKGTVKNQDPLLRRKGYYSSRGWANVSLICYVTQDCQPEEKS